MLIKRPFVACSHKRNRILTNMRKVLSLTQEESLRARDRGTISHIPQVLTIPIPHLLPKEHIDTGTSSNQRKGYLAFFTNHH